MRLGGKVAFVTGGARGIGKSVATALSEAGARVAIVDVDISEAQKTCAEIAGRTGNTLMAIRTDITVPDQVNAMIESILSEFGRLDIAFCNAGISNEVAVEDDTYEDWKKIIEVNLNGTFLTAQAAGRVMLKQGAGSIICTASMSAHIVNVPQREASYAASKAAVIQMCKAMAVEWATRNVRVHTISPGYMATEMTLNSPALVRLIGQCVESYGNLIRFSTPR